MDDVVILSAVRTATGKFLGSLKHHTAPQLGSLVIAEAVRRAGIEPAEVDECIMGHVVGAGVGQNPARQAALGAGLPASVGALSINKVCGSGLKSVMLAAQAIQTGNAGVVVAGGMESMSQCPYLLPKVREGLRMGHGQVVDSMVHDGLWCPFENHHMGLAGETVASRYQVSRLDQDAYAAQSHRRAARAAAAGYFAREILPVDLPQRGGPALAFAVDESVRADSTPASLAALKPAFKKDGTVTAGNAPPVNDGASALLLTSSSRARAAGLRPLARVVAQATSGLEPALLLMTPVEAVRRVCAKAGWSLDSVDLVEINEAFAVQAVAVIRELGLDPERVNVHGGAVALGHAIGSSGSRILTTLVYAMERGGATRGIAALCLGGGNGVALAVERAA